MGLLLWLGLLAGGDEVLLFFAESFDFRRGHSGATFEPVVEIWCGDAYFHEAEAVFVPFCELFFGCVFVDVGAYIGHVDGVEVVAVGYLAYAAGYPVGRVEVVFVAEGVEVCLAGLVVVLSEELDVGFVHVFFLARV